MIRFSILVTSLLMLGCAGLKHGADLDLPPPRVIAILPVSGGLSALDRDLVRALLRNRLATRRVRVVENDWVDRKLIASGWLADEQFEPEKLDPVRVCTALQVDGFVIGSAFRESRLDLLLYFRRSFSGRLDWWNEGGSKRWWVEHSKSKSGGLVVQSGQILKAFRTTTGRAAPTGFTHNVEAWLDESLATLPEWSVAADDEEGRPTITSVALDVSADGRRVDVTASADPGAELRFDLAEARHVPMTEVAQGEYRGSYVRVPGSNAPVEPKLEVVWIRDRFGREGRHDG